MALESVKRAAAAVANPQLNRNTGADNVQRVDFKNPGASMNNVTNAPVMNINLENAGENGQQEDEKEAEARIKSAVAHANDKVKHTGRTNCEFSYNEEIKRIAIKVFDSETKEVIREIPAEETLEMLEQMYELTGILVDERR